MRRRVKRTPRRRSRHLGDPRDQSTVGETAGKPQKLAALVANGAGEIIELDGYAAVGADGEVLEALHTGNTKPLPHGSELMLLPERQPILFDIAAGRTVCLSAHPDYPGVAIYPVAAFNSPGYILTHTCAHAAPSSAAELPLFAYGAVGWQADGFRSAVARVDHEPRQDLRRMPMTRVRGGVRRLRRQLPTNRLCRHLEKCALTYGCPAAKNFFIGRYEAPLPTAEGCNARCRGCLSLQEGGAIPHSQDRIRFTPSPVEIAEIAHLHIARVDKAVVSFGQGCEGDPLLAAAVIGPGIREIRRRTAAGTINMNTNGSLPRTLEGLLDAGLDSIRVSINSFQPACYTAYFQPRNYRFEDVLESVAMALGRGVHVAINYLNCPGFSDTPAEREALLAFLERHPIQMIQWRNLNFDPLRYCHLMKAAAPRLGRPEGMRRLLHRVRQAAPHLRFGYFNPPKESFPESPTKPLSARDGQGP
ncbi:MAG: radical SAM protein [Desulfosarcinaceae bacterium]|nr:radical SAM protein [Desulfosarcinaceae bacterium]